MKEGRSFLAIAALCSAAVWATATAAATQKPAFDGAARLFGLESVTVVYPAGADEEAEINRISAMRRAEHLEREWEVRADVAPDDAVTEEQLAGNLLLLGWENRLIGTPPATPVYAQDESSGLFIDSISVLAGEDLLFGAVSPYNPESWLFFWSRIDLERDRFLVIPLIGSDWAVYGDYRVMAQGMFGDRVSWPPKRNPTAEMSHRDALPLPAKQRSAHYTAYSKLSDDLVRRSLAAREDAYSQVTRQLGTPDEGFVIDLFIYANDNDKERRTGVPAGAHSIPGRREIHMTPQVAQSTSPREEINVIAAELFGPAKITALHDGLSTLLDLPAGAEGLPLFAATLLEQENMPRIESLLDEEEMRKLLHRRVGLAASSLLVGWLRETGGSELLSRAYPSLWLDTATLGGWLGLSSEEAEAAFRKWVVSLARTGEAELEFRKERGRANQERLMGDRAVEAEALAKALEHKPDHPETLYMLGLALNESEQYEEAEKRLERLVGLSVGPKETRFVIFGYYQLARSYESTQRREKAEEAYERMLELPDQHEAHRMAREGLEALREAAGEKGDSPAE